MSLPIVRALVVTEDWPYIVNGGFLRWPGQAVPEAYSVEHSREFHLGEFLKVLTETVWSGFTLEITRAHRTQPNTPPQNLTEADLKADRGADVVGFRFNAPFVVAGVNRTLADYDMVLFFGINPVDPDPALQPEAAAIARFMENGGGFFATGDHENLGSSLAGIIPRVRSMRRWHYTSGAPVAPPSKGTTRIDTTRPGPDGIVNFEDQSDEFPQPIEPTLYGAGLTVRSGYIAHRYLPHPLLCSPQGMVTWLPDHMHEGLCEVPDNLAARTFTIGSDILKEYPAYAPSGQAAQPLAPVIVANGKVLPGTTSPVLDSVHTGGIDPAQGRTFGVIGAWDGHLVGKGRVVVDSTFHHFFNINLTGDRYLERDSLGPQHEQKKHGFYVLDSNGARVPTASYQMIMWYYRNIVYWLVPAGRRATHWWLQLADIAVRPKLKEELAQLRRVDQLRSLTLNDFYYFGQLAEAYLAAARGYCSTYTIQVELFKPRIPWWEWIQEEVKVWDPGDRATRGQQEVEQERLDAALGIGPRASSLMTLTLGAALVTAFIGRNHARTAGTTALELIDHFDEIFPIAVEHVRGVLLSSIDRGRRTMAKLEKVVVSR